MTDTVMAPMAVQRLQDFYVAQCKLVLWVIYEHPKDRPNDFVVRPHVEGEPLNQIAVCGTLPVARSYIPTGLMRVGRFENDDPCIVETWL